MPLVRPHPPRDQLFRPVQNLNVAKALVVKECQRLVGTSRQRAELLILAVAAHVIADVPLVIQLLTVPDLHLMTGRSAHKECGFPGKLRPKINEVVPFPILDDAHRLPLRNRYRRSHLWRQAIVFRNRGDNRQEPLAVVIASLGPSDR